MGKIYSYFKRTYSNEELNKAWKELYDFFNHEGIRGFSRQEQSDITDNTNGRDHCKHVFLCQDQDSLYGATYSCYVGSNLAKINSVEDVISINLKKPDPYKLEPHNFGFKLIDPYKRSVIILELEFISRAPQKVLDLAKRLNLKGIPKESLESKISEITSDENV